MSFALLQSALLLPIELTLNQLLALDAASRSRLAAMAGKTIAVEVQQPALTIYVSVQTDKLR
ncbi:MAG: SCP2 sterol-binding domain-containing protein, partial [Pseudomonadota bacterium]